jgi:hypothetical protein
MSLTVATERHRSSGNSIVWQGFPDNYFKPCWDIAMKKLALTVSILALGSVSAFAGDLPSRVANANAYMDPAYNWTGFYTGVNLGQSWGRSRSTTHSITR